MCNAATQHNIPHQPRFARLKESQAQLTSQGMEKRSRLGRSDWLMAGFQALSTDGPVALKAEPMARRLKTTKGSFYWHFADVPDFHSQMLDLWATGAMDHIPQALAAQPTPVARLRLLSQIVSGGDHPVLGQLVVEPAIRAWARESAHVAQRLASVDTARIAQIKTLLDAVDITNPEMARIIYAAHIGMQDLTARDGVDTKGPMGSLVDLVLALR